MCSTQFVLDPPAQLVPVHVSALGLVCGSIMKYHSTFINFACSFHRRSNITKNKSCNTYTWLPNRVRSKKINTLLVWQVSHGNITYEHIAQKYPIGIIVQVPFQPCARYLNTRINKTSPLHTWAVNRSYLNEQTTFCACSRWIIIHQPSTIKAFIAIDKGMGR